MRSMDHSRSWLPRDRDPITRAFLQSLQPAKNLNAEADLRFPPPPQPQDFAERHGYVKGVVTDIIHDPGRGAPLAKVRR